MNPPRTRATRRGLPDSIEREAGASMLIAVMVITVVAVLCATMATLAMRSTRTAGDTRTAEVVKDLANAGLSQGITYLRNSPAGAVDAPAVADACSAPGPDSDQPLWTPANPAVVPAGTQGTYRVWIEKGTPGVYRVCAVGSSGQGTRTASVDVQYNTLGGGAGPYAVFSKADVDLQSSASAVTGLSVYSDTCTVRRHEDTVTGTDPSGNRAAAHAWEYVTNHGCVDEDSVHFGSAPNPDFPEDTDQVFGETRDSLDAFHSFWGLPDMLGEANITDLLRRATEQGNYHLNTDDDDVEFHDNPTYPHAVVFLDYTTAGQTVDLKKLNLGAWNNAACRPGQSLVLVTRNATVTANGNDTHVLRAIATVKNGEVKINGGFQLLGGLYADEHTELSGNNNVVNPLISCPAQDPASGGTSQVQVLRYRELDR